jgi:phosphate uptake regulator
MKDEIIEQVWRIKDAIAKKYKYDVRALAKDLQKRERSSTAVIVNLHDSRMGHSFGSAGR